MRTSEKVLVISLGVLGLLSSAAAQGRTPVQVPGRSPVMTRPAVRPSIIYLTPVTLRHPLNVYQELTLPTDPLLQAGVRVRGYTLDGLLRRVLGDPAALADDGYELRLQTRSGISVSVPLGDVYGKGGVLAYAEAGQMQWQRLPQGQVNPRSVYLVWPRTAPAPELSGLWDLTRLTLVKPAALR